MSYHGRILNPDGTALQGASVQFQMQVRSPGSENCLLYEEVQTIDMANSNGVFSITLNDGTGTRTDGGSYQFDSVFSNQSGFSLSTSVCAAGFSYTPNFSDGRSFVVSFRNENMSAYEPLPAQSVNFAPMAIQSKYINGYASTNLLKVDNSAAANNLTPFNSAQLTNLQNLVNGTSSQYLQTSSNGAPLPIVSAAPTSPSTGSVWYNSTTGQVQFYNGSSAQTLGTGSGSGTVTSIATGTGLTGGPITASGTISMANFGTAGSYYKVTTDATGRVSSGNSSLAETDLPTLVTAGKVSASAITSGTMGGSAAINTSGTIATSGNVTAANVSAGTATVSSILLDDTESTPKTATIQAPANITTSYVLKMPPALGGANQVLTTDISGNLSWTTPSTVATSYSGILPLANGGTGSADGSITGTGALTFNAGGANQNVALVPSGTGFTLLGGKIGIGTTSPSVSLDIGSRTDAIRVPVGTTMQEPSTPAAGMLRYNSSNAGLEFYNGTVWNALGTSSTTGTVTSVALSAPTIFTVAGSPITTNGTLSFSLASETAHQAFLAPAGASGAPSFRNFNISDLMSSVSGGFLSGSSSCAAGQALTYSSVSDSMSCTTLSLTSAQVTTALGFTPVNNKGSAPSLQEGAFSGLPAAGNVGAIYISSDTKSVYRDNGSSWDLLSNGNVVSSQWTTASSNIYYPTGNVGVGTATPTQPLEVNGNIRVGSQTSRTTATSRGQIGLGSTYVSTSSGSTTIDWSKGNLQELSTFICNGSNTITMSNVQDGSAYTLLLSGTAAHSGTCLFASSGFTFGTAGGAIAPVAGKNVMFSFIVMNTTVLYTMFDNIQ